MPSRKIDGRRFVVTGTLSAMSRAEVEAALKAVGGLVARNVTKSSDVLIVGTRPGNQLAKAKALGIEIWTEKQLRSALQRASGSLPQKEVTSEPNPLASGNQARRKAASDGLEGLSPQEERSGFRPSSARRTVAEDTDTPPVELKRLSQDKDPGVRARVAASPETPHSVLNSLALDDHWVVRKSVAKNPSTPQQALKALAMDTVYDVRARVPQNEACTTALLVLLAKDPAPLVRFGVAMNASCPATVLEHLAHDDHPFVRGAVAAHPHTSVPVLEKLAAQYGAGGRVEGRGYDGDANDPVEDYYEEYEERFQHQDVLQSLAQNVNTPNELRRTLGRRRN